LGFLVKEERLGVPGKRKYQNSDKEKGYQILNLTSDTNIADFYLLFSSSL